MTMRRRGLIAALLLLPLPATAEAVRISIAVGKVLTLTAPSGTTFQPGVGDSATGLLSGDGFRLSLDYGLYSDPLVRPDFGPLLRAEDLTIDGRAGRLFLWRAPPGALPVRIGLHVPSVAPSGMGPLRLTIAGLVADDATAERMTTMFRTIRFLVSP